MDAGDIYSLAFSYSPADASNFSAEKAILFFGCQNTSLQWIDLSSAKLGGHALNSAAEEAFQPKPSRLADTESATESSSDQELEYELEYDFEGEDEVDGDDHSLVDADDEEQHAKEIDPTRSRLKVPPRRPPLRPPRKLHKFFDSQPRGSRNLLPSASNDPHLIPRNTSFSSAGSAQLPATVPDTSTNKASPNARPGTFSKPKPQQTLSHCPRVLRVSSANAVESAHYGYIYCMSLVPPPKDEAQIGPFGMYQPSVRYKSNQNERENGEIRLVTGSGDEDVKVSIAPRCDILLWRQEITSCRLGLVICTFLAVPYADASSYFQTSSLLFRPVQRLRCAQRHGAEQLRLCRLSGRTCRCLESGNQQRRANSRHERGELCDIFFLVTRLSRS